MYMTVKKMALAFFSLLCFSASAFADFYNEPSIRSGKWEATFMLTHNDEVFVEGLQGASLDVKETTGWGASLGYNYSDHLQFNLEFLSSVPNYTATFISDEDTPQVEIIQHELNVVHTQFNAVYNFRAERLTPYVQAGLGWSYVDSNIADGPAQGVCWWDPWWGYVCEGYQPTYHESNFTYNVGVGLRYELDNEMIFKVSYGRAYSNLSHSDDLAIDIFKFEIGALF